MGSGNLLEIDGIGGGHPLTSKVAIVSPSRASGADVDYLFAQVKVESASLILRRIAATCLQGLARSQSKPAWFPRKMAMTRVRIFNVNTGKLIEAKVATPGRQVVYDGDASIDGVPGTAAPYTLHFSALPGRRPASCCRPAVRSIG